MLGQVESPRSSPPLCRPLKPKAAEAWFPRLGQEAERKLGRVGASNTQGLDIANIPGNMGTPSRAKATTARLMESNEELLELQTYCKPCSLPLGRPV